MVCHPANMATTTRDRYALVSLTVLLGIGLTVGGLAAGALMLWLLGPIITVAACLLAAVVFLAVRGAIRAARTS